MSADDHRASRQTEDNEQTSSRPRVRPEYRGHRAGVSTTSREVRSGATRGGTLSPAPTESGGGRGGRAVTLSVSKIVEAELDNSLFTFSMSTCARMDHGSFLTSTDAPRSRSTDLKELNPGALTAARRDPHRLARCHGHFLG